MIYFVLHGFNSATPNDTSDFFEENFPEHTVVNLNYNFNPEIGVKELEDTINSVIIESMGYEATDYEYTFVGCSLGGFMAQYLAMRFGGKAIAINPAIVPYEDLTRFLGINTNYKTGEKFELTMDDVKNYAPLAIKPGTVPTLILLDMGDELLNSAHTVNHFSGKAEIHTFEGGCHRFSHMAESLESIEKFANTLTV